MKWTDKRVKEFVKIATSGSWGDYSGCTSLDSKMKKFKKIKGGSNGS
jgi:hypothetical protein